MSVRPRPPLPPEGPGLAAGARAVPLVPAGRRAPPDLVFGGVDPGPQRPGRACRGSAGERAPLPQAAPPEGPRPAPSFPAPAAGGGGGRRHPARDGGGRGRKGAGTCREADWRERRRGSPRRGRGGGRGAERPEAVHDPPRRVLSPPRRPPAPIPGAAVTRVVTLPVKPEASGTWARRVRSWPRPSWKRLATGGCGRGSRLVASLRGFPGKHASGSGPAREDRGRPLRVGAWSRRGQPSPGAEAQGPSVPRRAGVRVLGQQPQARCQPGLTARSALPPQEAPPCAVGA